MNDAPDSKVSEDDEIDLRALSNDELVEQMHDDLYDGLREEIVEGTQILLERNWAPDKVLNDALVEGMRVVGIDFRTGPGGSCSRSGDPGHRSIGPSVWKVSETWRSGQIVVGYRLLGCEFSGRFGDPLDSGVAKTRRETPRLLLRRRPRRQHPDRYPRGKAGVGGRRT